MEHSRTSDVLLVLLFLVAMGLTIASLEADPGMRNNMQAVHDSMAGMNGLYVKDSTGVLVWVNRRDFVWLAQAGR